MELKKTEAKVFLVKMMCDCGGEFTVTGSNTWNPKPKPLLAKETFKHECKKCKKEVTLDRSYPYLNFEEI